MSGTPLDEGQSDTDATPEAVRIERSNPDTAHRRTSRTYTRDGVEARRKELMDAIAPADALSAYRRVTAATHQMAKFGAMDFLKDIDFASLEPMPLDRYYGPDIPLYASGAAVAPLEVPDLPPHPMVEASEQVSELVAILRSEQEDRGREREQAAIELQEQRRRNARHEAAARLQAIRQRRKDRWHLLERWVLAVAAVGSLVAAIVK